MKAGALVLALAGLALGWGYYGQKQIKTGLYDCEVRVDQFCFLWKKNDLGNAQDGVGDKVNRDVNR